MKWRTFLTVPAVDGGLVGRSLAALAMSALVGCLSATAPLAVGTASAATSSSTEPTPEHLIAGPAVRLPQSLFVASQPMSPNMVTSTQAEVITRDLWRLWETALIARDTMALTQLVAPGPLLQSEIYDCVSVLPRCVEETSPRPMVEVRTVVPSQSNYPLYFLAEIRTDNYIDDGSGAARLGGWIELQILTKTSPARPWQLAFDTGYDGPKGTTPSWLGFDSFPLPAGYEPPGAADVDPFNPVPIIQPLVPTTDFLARTAQYWQAWKDDGRAPEGSLFQPAGIASAYGAAYAQHRQDRTYLGVREHYDFSADPAGGEWTFSAFGRFPMVCGTVIETVTTRPAARTALDQPPNRSNYGTPLPSGRYRQIATQYSTQTCTYETNGGQNLDAIGDSGDIVAVTGDRYTGGTGSSAIANLRIVAGGLALIAVFVLRIVGWRRRRAGRTTAASPIPAYPAPPAGPAWPSPTDPHRRGTGDPSGTPPSGGGRDQWPPPSDPA